MNKKQLTPDIVESIVGELLNTRLMCGSEREVMREWKYEYSISETQECEIAERVADEWNKMEREARGEA